MSHRQQTWETEQCPSCLQLYSFEIQYRCIECDEPVEGPFKAAQING